jgi:hypothetical protein
MRGKIKTGNILYYRIQLEMALMKLQAAQKPEELHLWGKITG